MSFLKSLGSLSGEMHVRTCYFSSSMYGLIEIDFWFSPSLDLNLNVAYFSISDIHNSMKIKLQHYSKKKKKEKRSFPMQLN